MGIGQALRESAQESMMDMVKSIEQYTNNNPERRGEISFYLWIIDGWAKGDAKISFETHEYSTGENIIATLGNPPYIGIGSHYDAAPDSPGANDNASAVAVTLDLLRRAKQNPLENIGLKGFFFDEEEKGLKGSKEYVKKYSTKDLIGLYNMDMVGSGDRLALWSINDSQDSQLLKTLESKANEKRIETYRVPIVLTHGADHQSFNEAGLEDAFTITTISELDAISIPKYISALESGASEEKLYTLMLNADIMKHYHKPTDTSDKLSQETLQMVSDLLWNSIKEIDKNYKKSW